MFENRRCTIPLNSVLFQTSYGTLRFWFVEEVMLATHNCVEKLSANGFVESSTSMCRLFSRPLFSATASAEPYPTRRLTWSIGSVLRLMVLLVLIFFGIDFKGSVSIFFPSIDLRKRCSPGPSFRLLTRSISPPTSSCIFLLSGGRLQTIPEVRQYHLSGRFGETLAQNC